MTFDDDTLMAYADGELDPQQRAAIELAMRQDPAIAAAVARHRALRQDVFAAFAGVLDEPVPARLQPPAGARVHDIDAARGARAQAQQRKEEPARRRAWPQWGAMAASLAVGVFAGLLGPRVLDAGSGAGSTAGVDLARGPGGELTATGRLARALDRQLAQERGAGDVQVGLSFLGRDGSYCRTFRLGGSGGLACRQADAWRIPVLADAPAQGGDYRQAGADIPPAVLDAVDERIAGATLDATAERSARDRGWAVARPAQQ